MLKFFATLIASAFLLTAPALADTAQNGAGARHTATQQSRASDRKAVHHGKWSKHFRKHGKHGKLGRGHGGHAPAPKHK